MFFVLLVSNEKFNATNGKNKENIMANSRAIIAIQKLDVTQKPTLLKNILKKSMSVPTATAQPSKASALITQKAASVSNLAPKKEAQFSAIGQRQYDYAKTQKKRMDERVRVANEQKEKELKIRFHAKPAPKFKKSNNVVQKQQSVVHKQQSVEARKLTKQNSLPTIHLHKKMSRDGNVPSCGDPEVLKYIAEKRRLLLEKYQEPHKQFKAKPAAVLKKQPFQPVSNVKPIEHKLFKLHLTDRLGKRSEWEKKRKDATDIRKQQEENRLRQKELEIRKILRQKTEFKARGNPFGFNHI